MDKLSFSDESDQSDHPSPADFDNYLPWACFQLQVETRIHILKSEQDQYNSPYNSGRLKGRKPASNKGKEEEKTDLDVAPKSTSPSLILGVVAEGNVVNINTIYDQFDQLVELKFEKNQTIPRGVFQIIKLIIQFHPHLSRISINGGLKKDGLYEISKLLCHSTITEMILDNTVILEANYYILLDENNHLKYLSLARCKLNDAVVKMIASRLEKSSLSILNLTSNRITDVGATYLADALRLNRKLTYLNLADNMITDEGAANILTCLMLFPLRPDEIRNKKARHIAYLKLRNKLVKKVYTELGTADPVKNVPKKRLTKPVVPPNFKKLKGLDGKESLKPSIPNIPVVDSSLLAKAIESVKASLGPFKDPFSSENTITKDGTIYCLGNNILAYLNLAYNNLTYFSVKKLCDALSAQEDARRVPRGLINVCIEGNNIPESCPELTEIDYILQTGFATLRRISTVIRKRPVKLNLNMK